MSKSCNKSECAYYAVFSCRYEEIICDGGDFGMTWCDQEQYEEEIRLMRMNMEVSIFEN